MRKISFVLMMLIANIGSAAGLNQLIDSFKKPVTVPQPAVPQPAVPQPAVPQPAVPQAPKPPQPVKK
jgi:hypothetical protein